MNAMDHVRQLAEKIGPRGSTTPEERSAADYVQAYLSSLGLHPIMESFRSARSAWLPAALFWSIVLAAGFLFLGGGRVNAALAFVLAGVGLGSILLELSFRPNLLRWILPKGQSQNVWARIEAEDRAREQVVLVAHLDTHRTPLVFSSDQWVRWFQRLVPIGLFFAVLLVATFALGIAMPVRSLQYAALGPMLVALGMLVLMLQADFTVFTPGANDNASGVGIVLSAAEQLSRHPLERTTVWIVLTGCEEVGCYGAEDFIRRHGAELGRATWVTIDTVGSRGGTPVYLSRETFLSTAKSDPKLLEMVHEVSLRGPGQRAHEVCMKGAYTEGAIGARHGLRVLTVESRQHDGTLSEWHRPADTVDNVSAECMQATETLLLSFLSQLDASAPFD